MSASALGDRGLVGGEVRELPAEVLLLQLPLVPSHHLLQAVLEKVFEVLPKLAVSNHFNGNEKKLVCTLTEDTRHHLVYTANIYSGGTGFYLRYFKCSEGLSGQI